MMVSAGTKRVFLEVILLVLAVSLYAIPAGAQKIDIVEGTLDNGMQVLMVEKHDAPTIIGAIFFHVGAANEVTGITGISHLFEHMMFKGSKVIGTADSRKDRKIMDQLDALKERMREEERVMRENFHRGRSDDMYAPEAKTARYLEFEGEFNDLLQQQKESIVKDEFSEIYKKHGGYFLNAFTSDDMTAYFVRLPKNKIELFLWMEADRIQNAAFREFYSERDVVLEERRLNLESTPTGRLEESFNAMFWESGPYGWDVFGWPSDIRSITREDARWYRETYYAPNNATAMFIGDFDPDELFGMVKKYFGPIPRGKETPPDVVTLEIEQVGAKRLVGEAETSPQIEVRFHTVAFQHPDSYPLQILAGVLSGKSGRLYKKLVLEDGIALSGSVSGMMGTRLHVDAGQDSRKYGGYFSLSAEGKDDVGPEELGGAIHGILEDLKENPVTEYELEKVKNQVIANNVQRIRQFQGIGLMFYLGSYAALGDYSEFNMGMDKLLTVTTEDIRRVANKYFDPWKRNELLVHPKQTEEGAIRLDPETKQFLGMIESMEDAEQLGRMLGMIQMRMEDMTDEEKQQGEVLLKAAKERLGKIKAKKDS
ncbi:MAG: insulinase family protein [Candidatus Eisenbacteria sp.]|nr:insulinase family protein [Candidatus Eisenbacteria bacterium]